jgi:hypothetical protein
MISNEEKTERIYVSLESINDDEFTPVSQTRASNKDKATRFSGHAWPAAAPDA